MKSALPILLVAMVAGRIYSAPVADHCVSCSQRIVKKVFLLTSPYFTDKQPVCDSCAQLPARCEMCQLPVLTNVMVLKDGRVLCQADFRQGVFSTDEAFQLFNEAKRSVIRMLAGTGTAPDKNIKVVLADRGELESLLRTQRFPHARSSTQGLTRSTPARGDRPIEHEIFLINGVRRSRFLAVCAHEYGHAWLHENLQQDRELESDTVEGFCELLAYKVMTELNEPFEKQIILTNAYSNGQISALLQAEGNYRFYELVKWMKTGADKRLETTNTSRVLQLKKDDSAQWGWLPQAKTQAPERLVLRSISGPASRRYAMINNQTLTKGEAAKVRVGSTHVTVRLLGIGAKSVIVKVDDSAELAELFLESPAAP